MPQNRTLRLGTRGSKLALVQAEMVRSALMANGKTCDIVVLKTSGDRIQDRSLADAGGKGLFVKELEDALLRDDVDLAVHSMKDVPTDLPAGLVLTAFLPREDPSEAFLSHKARTLNELPKGAKVGTSSVRRHAQVARLRSDLEIVLLRGNVDTRLRKLDEGEMDAIFLAYAGLKRLGLQARATTVLDPKICLPSLGQGVIGIEVRASDADARNKLAFLNHEPSQIALACERAFQSALDGSCRTPIAGLATVDEDILVFRGEVLAPDGSDAASTSFTTPLGNSAVAAAEKAGRDAGLALKPRVAKWLAL
jgi:hydroxymethylbilane synthase